MIIKLETVKATLRAKGTGIFFILAFIAGIIITPFVAPSIVALVGFEHEGIRKDSWAAKMQAAIGNIEADSPFALAQSIGMGGRVPLYGFVAGGVILVVLSAPIYFSLRYIISLITRWVKSKKEKELSRINECKNDDEEMQVLKPGYFYAI